jgi:hypothetical protein
LEAICGDGSMNVTQAKIVCIYMESERSYVLCLLVEKGHENLGKNKQKIEY